MGTITIKDVAKLCGVGVSTVSRAINNHPDINDETKTKIMKVIKENNYIPNNSARNLKRSNSRMIAVLIKGISNPFFSKMIKVIEEETQEKKYSFLLHRVEDREDEIDVALELVKEKKLRGIIFLGGYFNHSEEKLAQLDIPYVLCTVGLNTGWKEGVCSFVAVDDFKESYKIVDYLCKNGHKRIAIITTSMDDTSIGLIRYNGYLQALRDNGIEPDQNLVRCMKYDIETFTMDNGYVVMKELLDSKEDFTAVFAISDSIAIGACKAVFDAGKKIPEDYSVAGFDGLDVASYYNPTLTTIRQPVEEIAQAAVTILFDVIKKKAEHRMCVFPGELIVGQSTRKIN
ncbi:LacI family DNA-binding transcriptional regulator [Anaerosporobacter faecicola]|uniref:LacI family DNA-binding transcriptional regulator n=1 Tax=Anaerosporobacter faecicola TaxID=2718714 RepID=UPI00143B2586|nr:LacI family DNA-binding transcriptional regulator [Anaerosporobacter faecicola]